MICKQSDSFVILSDSFVILSVSEGSHTLVIPSVSEGP